MSNRETLAEHGSALCLAALGVIAGGATLASAIIPVAVLTTIGLEKWAQCDANTVKSAKDAILTALSASRDISEGEITAAAELLKSAKTPIKFDPVRMTKAVKSGDLPTALVREVFPDALKGEDPGTRTAVTLAMQAAFDIFRQNEKYRDVFTQEMVMELLREKRVEITLLEDLNAKVDQLIDRERDLARELGVQEGMLIALARRYAEGNPSDFDAALRGLERALTVAADEIAKNALPANTDAAVDKILKQVDALNEDGRIDDAATLIAEEESRAEAGLIRLYDKGIAQAILTRDSDAAATYELKKLPIEVPDPTARFTALRVVRRTWYERGRDKGLNFDLEVSITLARASIQAAQSPNQSGAALNDLGAALRALGERETGTERLEDAVTAYRAAFEEFTRDRVPLKWATTQMNLGTALAALGERETGTDRLEDAITAFRAALEENTRDRVPLKWATTQMNLGTALQTLGQRETGTARLEDAVTAFRAALEERTRDRVPLKWATTQMNLANVLQTLGKRETGTERLEDAVTAYRAALEENTRDRVPLEWAMTNGNLTNVELAFFDKTADRVHLDRAQSYLDAAREVFGLAGAAQYLAVADNQQARINARRAD
jgi:tetratricopeptide (TPR) repeat protein